MAEVKNPLALALQQVENPRDGRAVLNALARNQAQQFNANPLSQAMNRDLTRNFNAVAEALMVPGKAARGDYNDLTIYSDGSVSPVSEALIGDANKLAGVIGTGSVASPRPTGSLGSGGSNFDRWFGNSQVRNPDGSPQTLYHGTTGNFDTFRVPTDGAGNPRAVYLTPDPAVASQYAAGRGSVIPAYVKAEKLLTVDLQGGATDAMGRSREAIVRQARADGYDGVLLKNTGDVGGVQDQYAVFNPAQIKSATGNSGAYDPADPSIVRLSGVPIIQGEERRERKTLNS